MFAPTGLFKDVSCSYFLFGLCERPYCHFKHSRQDEAKARLEAEKTASLNKVADDDYKPPASALQRTLQDIENSIKSEKKKLGNHENTINNEAQNKCTLKNKPTGTPEYNPTPITELKKKKIEGKLGRSKYDLALLAGPATDGEYDPASNYSTGSKSSTSVEETEVIEESVPDYAKQFHGTKRPAEEDENDEDQSPLTKIPKFVSVEYTPALNESVELSDDEPLGEFSDEASAKESDSDHGVTKHSDSDCGMSKGGDSDQEISETEVGTGVIKLHRSAVGEENKVPERKSLLPIEFTSDGFVKSDLEIIGKKKGKTKSNKSKSGKPKKCVHEKTILENDKPDVTPKEKDRSNVNIFSLFKQEFDDALETCSSVSTPENSVPNVKLKSRSVSKDQKTKLPVPKLSRESQLKHESKSGLDHKYEAQRNTLSCKNSEKTDSSSHKTKASSVHKHLSRSSVDKQCSSSLSNIDSHKTNGAISDKHKHSSRKVDLSISKHRSSSNHKVSSSSLSVSSKHKHSSSESHHHPSGKFSSSSKKPAHKSSKSSDNKPKDFDKMNDTHSAKSSGKKSQSNSKAKVNEHSVKRSMSSSLKSGSEKPHKKKKHIVNLDIDLFGTESDDMSTRPAADDDYMSDLDKYFLEDDPFDECLRIFNEESANKPSTSGEAERKKLKKSADHGTIRPAVTGKKRVALKESDPNEKKKKVESKKPVPKPSPAQVMMNRYKMMQSRILQAELENKEKMKAKVRQMSQKNAMKASTSPSKPNLASAAATFTTYISNKNKKTTAITATKGSKRKAHTPTVSIAKLKRPTVEVSTSSKVGTNVRQRYLNLFIDECLKILTKEEEAFKRGKEEEEAVYKRCSNKNIYLNIAVNTVKRLRTEVEEKKSGRKSAPCSKKLSHASMLDGAVASKTSYTVHRSGGAVKLKEEDFTGVELYKRLQPFILNEEMLRQNNFPHPDPVKGGTAIFYGEERYKQKGTIKGYEKLCIRCGSVFEVYPNGKYPVKEECVYHWGKAWKKKIAGSIETRYTCCQGDLASEGCQVAKLHVHETNKREIMSGFMKTIPCSPPIDGDYGVYAMDCEMVYTTMGIELARVTVVDSDLEPVYESLVLPDNPVVDLNTRFSGITEDDMEDVHTSLRDVQAVLLSLFTDKTILMGHSLESDLTALKLIHNTVVDTSLVFPHRMGPPFKRALKNLMADYLQKIIQDDVGGHDSLEDAVACLQLMQYRLKDDARREGRRLSC